MQNILSGDMEKSSESNLGILSSGLILECGHKHLYTVIKKDIDGLHKDKLHRLTPASFTVSRTFWFFLERRKKGQKFISIRSPFSSIIFRHLFNNQIFHKLIKLQRISR